MTQRFARVMAAAAVVMMTVACGAPKAPTEPSPALPSIGGGTAQVGGRDVTVYVPDSYDPARPAPLVVALHGYTSDAKELETYLRLIPESQRTGFVYAYPDGSADAAGDRFWNATDACCAFSSRAPDDSRHLSELITTMQARYRIDPARVYLIGHSNGGFMTFRMACDHADQIAAIVSLNGAGWNDAARCEPSGPVSVLAIHSSADETVAFAGGDINGVPYPSADTTVAQWVGYDRCSELGRDGARLDLVPGLPGAETSVRIYQRGCEGASTVQAWTIEGGDHVPRWGPDFAPAVTDFLLSRTKAGR
ncbi:alpha/beta fold hydrolase [Actinoplanes sp. NPDC023714]|uniref:alpha/beta hydrolase family esterase n=1 Tax=Actinoplanes sp. NPDC023714 TaxID=3154322 RepID=UPI0033CAC495